MLYQFRAVLGRVREAGVARLRRLRENLIGGTERRLREEVANLAQTSHVASSLFPLDLILIPPRLLAPDPGFDPTAPLGDDDLTTVIPNLPEWPDMAGLYRLPTLSVEAAFKSSTHVVVLGSPGSGKTTLLAHLATRAAQGDEALFPGNPTPVFVHVADLNLAGQAEEVAQPLVAAQQMHISALAAPQLPGHLLGRLKRGQCVIFLDGFDELPPKQVAEVANWLTGFLKAYGENRVIAAAGLWGYAPLVRRDLAPIHLAPWGPEDFRALVKKWGDVLEQARAKNRFIGPGNVAPEILMGWVSYGNQGRSVLEVTLKIWAAFTGDARGNRPGDWLEAYRLRLGAGAKPAEALALGQMALALLANDSFLGATRADLVKVCDAAFTGPGGKVEADSEYFLDRLLKQQVLVKRANDRLCFRYPHVMAYSAAAALVAHLEAVPPQLNPPWVLTVYFLAGLGNVTPVVNTVLQQPADLLYTDLFACARWLRDAPATASWRTEVFRRLSRLLIEKALPENLRLRALAGLVAANDPAVLALFKQVVASPEPFARRLGVLGLGASGDPSLVPFVEPLFADPYLDVRWAVALALAAFGSEAALDELAHGLMAGEDNVRQACAQALARMPEVGHPLLKEAVAQDDLAARHAAVYGLLDTRADWALKILEEMQVHEKEWLVRNAAIGALAQWKSPPDRAPKPRPAPDALGWLIAWAATQGVGVPPGKAALEVVNRALREGDEPNRRAAAETLGRLCDPALVRELYATLRDPAPLLRDAAFCALGQVSAATAQRLPVSMV